MIDSRHYPEHSLLVIELKGEVEFEKFMEWYTPLIEQANLDHPGPDAPNRLYDVRPLKLDITTEQVRELTEWVQGLNAAVGHCRSAFLTDSNLMYGLLRQFVEFGRNPNVNRAVFRDTGEALGWLGIEPSKSEFLGL